MKENIDQIFYQEVREKKTTAAGVHGKKGKKGHVGKIVTPADISSREYREPRDLPSFNVYDFIHKLHEAPTLKNVLLARMDEEHRTYRQATEKTLDALAEILQLGLDPLYEEIAVLKQAVADLARRVENRGGGGQAERTDVPLTPRNDMATAAGRSGSRLPLIDKKRIRWGSDPATIRETVFGKLLLLEEQGEEITTETIKQRIPSMLRWIYGERAVFGGIDGLRRDYQAWKQAREAGAVMKETAAPAEIPGEELA